MLSLHKFPEMRTSFLFLILFLFMCFNSTDAQYYETGQSPASFKWKEIETDNFRVIFPDFYAARAARLASALEASVKGMEELYISSGKKIPVIVHASSIQSNGYVSWAPKRMELFPLPEQDNLPMDQLEQLAIHEATHVLQLNSLNYGISKGLSSLFGEHITGAVSAYIPMWFLEGDAVFAETAFSASGRGRDPDFLKNFKALTLEKGELYNYDKLIQGSYRDYVPNHYESGYLASLWVRNNYGPGPWRNALNYTARNPWSVSPFNISLRRDAGRNKQEVFRSAFATMDSIWQKDDRESGYKIYDQINPGKKGDYIGYRSPVKIGPDTVIAVKTSYYLPPQFVMITGKERKETTLFTPGQMNPYHLAAGRDKIVWAENRPDPRWENRGFSVIMVYDFGTGIARKISSLTRYFGPDISSDGKMIVAASSSESYANSLVILDATSGELIKEVAVPGNSFPEMPKWSSDNSKITMVALSEEGESIMMFDMGSGSWSTLIPTGRDNLKISFLRNDSLFYISSANGTSDLYIKQGEEPPFAATSTRFGAGEYTVSGNSIVFSEYHADGYSLSETAIEALPDRNTAEAFFSFSDRAMEQGKPLNYYSSESYEVRPYRKTLHLLNFHSWLPVWADLDAVASDPTTIKPGITLFSQNNLSTLITTLGYEYDRGNHIFHSGIKWMGSYPVWESTLSWGGDPDIYTGPTGPADPLVIAPGLRFRNDIYIPLKTSTGKWTQSYMPHLYSSYNNQYIYISERDVYDYGQLFITGRFYFTNIHRSAYRDIYPRFAQLIDVRKTATPFDKELYGPVSTIKTAAYFPGILRNNGIRIRYEHELQKPEKFIQFNKALFPRGIDNIIAEELDFFSADYVFPIVYPDLRISSIAYFQRLRGGLFYDRASGRGVRDMIARDYNPGRENWQSVGAEIITDLYLFRLPFPISAGARGIYLPDTKTGSIEMVFDIDIYGFGFKERFR